MWPDINTSATPLSDWASHSQAVSERWAHTEKLRQCTISSARSAQASCIDPGLAKHGSPNLRALRHTQEGSKLIATCSEHADYDSVARAVQHACSGSDPVQVHFPMSDSGWAERQRFPARRHGYTGRRSPFWNVSYVRGRPKRGAQNVTTPGAQRLPCRAPRYPGAIFQAQQPGWIFLITRLPTPTPSRARPARFALLDILWPTPPTASLSSSNINFGSNTWLKRTETARFARCTTIRHGPHSDPEGPRWWKCRWSCAGARWPGECSSRPYFRPGQRPRGLEERRHRRRRSE